MSFARKVFISVFVTTLLLGTALIWVAHSYVAKQTNENFISRYSSFSQVLSDTLSQLDNNTEAFMLNAAKVVAAKDAEHGLLSTESLKELRSEVNVTHIFVIDKNGNFIRSTNEDPKLIPNAYSFCQGYRGLIAGTTKVEATPIIHPQPEPKPYKFLFVPSYDRKRLLEVGVRVDFIGKTLTKAMGSDSNLLSMSLFSPTGTAFGKFENKEVNFDGEAVALPASFPQVVDNGNSLRFFTKVKSSHPKCCQCEVSGTSKNGEYYYVLASDISKKELIVAQATTRNAFFILGLVNLILAYGFSRFVARRLVKNIETAVGKVRAMKESGNLKSRIHLTGKDEVSYLTNEFDRLLDSLDESQQKIIEAEMIQAKVQLARDVAHNIKSPIIAIEMMLPMVSRLPERIQKVLSDSVREIKELADRMSRQADSLAERTGVSGSLEVVDFRKNVEDEVHKKQIEFLANFGIDIQFQIDAQSEPSFVEIDPIEFRAVISNLINNGVESYGANGGTVSVSVARGPDSCSLQVKDSGRGIPESVLNRLGTEAVSVGKDSGKGLGLLHAHRCVSAWRGKVEIDSSSKAGTSVKIVLPTCISQGTPTGKLALVEDSNDKTASV